MCIGFEGTIFNQMRGNGRKGRERERERERK